MNCLIKVLILIISSVSLLSCPSIAPNTNPNADPHKKLLPIWQQTDYIFYNNTGDQVTVTHFAEGKVRKRDGTLLERSDGGSLGEDGIFREFILNDRGEQEVVTREYKKTSVKLRNGECVFTSSYYVLEFEIKGKTACSNYRHGEPDPKRSCSSEINPIRGKKGWRDTSHREEGPFSYVEFYNIINKQYLFEGAKEPQQLDNSFTHSCKILSQVDYRPLK